MDDRMLPQSVIDGASGYASGAFTDAVFYGLDSYKTQKQAGGPVQLSRVFCGLGPISLTGSGPSLAAFFVLYGPIRDAVCSTL
jgi:hypothetical protein